MNILILASLSIILSACMNMRDDIANIGKVPAMSPISNPVMSSQYTPVSLPMPSDINKLNNNGKTSGSPGLWQPSSYSFFKDNRASRIGDILTVNIAVTDTAQLNNSTQTSKAGDETIASSSFASLFGIKDSTNSSGTGSSLNLNSDSALTGTGSINRNEVINLTVAAVVIQTLPNGNLVIRGSQEMRVNNEVRELLIMGVVRPADISANNTIQHTQIAEARVSYGGRGNLTQVQQARYGQQFLDAVLPW